MQNNTQHVPPPGEPATDKVGGENTLKMSEQSAPTSYVEREQSQGWSSRWEAI